MSALTEFLFPAPAERTTSSIVRWWESRRLLYNLAVGGAGLFSLGAIRLIAWLPPHMNGGGYIPWQGIVLFGVMANICYLLGPVAEVTIEKLWGRGVLPTGPSLFRMGLTFSVGLALFPILLMIFGWVIRIVMAVF